MHSIYRLIGLISLLSLAACSDSAEQDTAENAQADADSPFTLALDMKNLMNLVVEPVADSLWESAGWVLSDAGYEELYPTTQEGWDFAYSQSAIIVELGNALAIPERAQGQEDWLTYARAMSTVGQSAMKATLEQNKDDYFQAGAQLYSVCTACHQAYNADISRFVDN